MSTRRSGPHDPERRREVETFLRFHAQWADTWIAHQLGMSRQTIRRARRRLQAAGRLPRVDMVIRRNGSSYPAELPCKDPLPARAESPAAS